MPIARCLVSYDNVTVPVPSWSYVDNDLQGQPGNSSFASSRGRNDELSEFDAGDLTISLNNRARAYDPNSNASIRPLNQIWLRSEFNGVTRDIFKGYVETWDQSWPSGSWSDAMTAAHASDEFKVLSLYALPNTSPPRSSYSDLVQADNPLGLWEMNVQPDQNIQAAEDVTPNPDAPIASSGPSRGLIPLFGTLGSPRHGRA
ncbi:MAG TPA: hypothetical protein VNH41_00400 [Steroidobacteraceae bacterium]|nr:hypothetical protein [Steroidobacteraceae bacterium]